MSTYQRVVFTSALGFSVPFCFIGFITVLKAATAVSPEVSVQYHIYAQSYLLFSTAASLIALVMTTLAKKS